MELALVADVHISPRTVSELQRLGFHICRVTDHVSPHASDAEIIQLARCHHAAIVTHDLDFSALVAQGGTRFPSVVSVRVEDARPRAVTQLLAEVLPLIEKDLSEGAIVSVEEARFRVRKLPI